MDTRQWIEPPHDPFYFLQPWAQISSDGCNVVVPWPGYPPTSQPPAQGFIPDPVGVQWNLDVQNFLDQSIGVVTTFPSTSYMSYNGQSDAITPMSPALDIRRSLNRLVPQRRYSNHRRTRIVRDFNPGQPIYFNTYSGPGFSMKDALDKNFKCLVGREDPMLSQYTAISLRFEFEGCDSWTRQVKTRDSRKIPHPIPREKLAHEVAKKLAAFLKFQKRRATHNKPEEESSFLNSADVKDLILLQLDHVSKASWQPQFMVVPRE